MLKSTAPRCFWARRERLKGEAVLLLAAPDNLALDKNDYN